MTSLDEIFQLGLKLREPEIVKKLVPDLKSEVVCVGIVQKQTDAGELTRFGAVVAVGNGNGFFGVGQGQGRTDEVRNRQGDQRRPSQRHSGPAWMRELGVQVRHEALCPVQDRGARREASGLSSCPAPRSLGTVAGPALDEPARARRGQGRLGQGRSAPPTRSHRSPTQSTTPSQSPED